MDQIEYRALLWIIFEYYPVSGSIVASSNDASFERTLLYNINIVNPFLKVK